MQAASLVEVKKELQKYSQAELLKLCMQLAKYKKDNKELLTYIIFHSHDLPLHLKELKKEMDNLFGELNYINLYITSKKIRKILRLTNKQIKHTGSKQAEVELLIHFCKKIIDLKIDYKKSTALSNLFNTQIKKINNAIEKLHEDLQYDFKSEVETLIL
jgi:gas vesicle protein